MQVLDWWMLGISATLLMYGIPGVFFSKKKKLPLGATVLGVIFFCMLRFSGTKPLTPIAEKQTTTHIYTTSGVWVAASTFQKVDGSKLFVGEVHRQGAPRWANQLVFLDTSSCNEKLQIPSVGEKVEVVLLEVKTNGSVVAENPSSATMTFAQPTCSK